MSDSYSQLEGLLYDKLPKCAKDELGKYENLALKGFDELHSILDKIRLNQCISPKNIFTLYMKCFTRVHCTKKNPNNSESYWINKGFERKDYSINRLDKDHAWYNVEVNVTCHGSKYPPVRLFVNPMTGEIWSYLSEMGIKGPTININDPTGLLPRYYLPTKCILEKTKEAYAAEESKHSMYDNLVLTFDTVGSGTNTAASETQEPEVKTPADYKPPMFPFDYDIRKESLPPRKQGIILTAEQEVLLRLMGEITGAQLDKLGAVDTASEIRALVKQLTGATNE